MIANALLAFGLVLIVEGLAYALAPSLVERLLEALRLLPLDQRRYLGLAAMAGGMLLAWVATLMGA